MGLLGLAVVAVVVLVQSTGHPATRQLRTFQPPPHVELRAPAARAEPEPLTPELRHKGFHECYPHDPMGLGPYAPYQNIRIGRIAIPQQGGHTADFGYDVVVHFHGHSAVRKTLVQVARGVAYVGIDKGLGSGPYMREFKVPDTFPSLRHSIEGALRRHTGDERAHIRHLALSCWSAGYGAVNEILKRHGDLVDAVVLLDGLHAAWSRTHRRHDGSVKSACDRAIYPTFDFARRALAGEKIFIFTHSNVDPDRYPSTKLTADLLLYQLGVERQPVSEGATGRFRQLSTADVAGLHVWGYEGTDTFAHCAHIPLMARALHVLEAAWDTPPMDRSVAPTPAPKLGKRDPDGADEVEGGIVLEPIGDGVSAGEADPGPGMDTAGLEPVPLSAAPQPSKAESPN
jgi:hypothetical protein